MGSINTIVIGQNGCDHCKKEKGVIARLKKSGVDIEFQDIRKSPHADQVQTGVPTIVHLCEGRVVGRSEGFLTESQLRKDIKNAEFLCVV